MSHVLQPSLPTVVNEALWKSLIAEIREGVVVPVVGPRLLVESDGRTPLMARVAEMLLAEYGIDVPPDSLPRFREINEAYTRLKQAHPPLDLYDVHQQVHELLRSLHGGDSARLPLPLQQLAEITDFRLLVTVTPDDALARALAQQRAVNEVVHSLALSEGDLAPEWKHHGREAHLLYLFGKTRPTQSYALHDEDTLEYAHNLLTRTKHVPQRFLQEVQQRGLLVIGCNFPDWLGRLLLRLTNTGPLSSEANKRKWLIEPLDPEESLTNFLRNHSKRVLQSNLDPIDFVAELHRRWSDNVRAHGQSVPAAVSAPDPGGVLFFVSYSRSTDLANAQALVRELKLLGAKDHEIWFDGHAIEPGNDFRMRIAEGIDSCRYFVPVLSAAADLREEAVVFSEWQRANDRLSGMNRDFVIPVIVDAEMNPHRYKAAPVSKWKSTDFGFAPRGAPDDRLRERLRDLVRDARRAGERRQPTAQP